MPKINLATGKPVTNLSSDELDRLLETDLSDTKDGYFSVTKISGTKDGVLSDTKPITDISDTKLSGTKYMREYKRSHYDAIRVDLPKGSKELLKEEAAKRNISVTKLIKSAILMYLNTK